MSDFRNLRVWQLSRLLIVQLFAHTKRHEFNGLTRSIRSTSLEIAHTIALAYGQTDGEQRSHYLRVALEQALKLDKCLYKAHSLGRLEETSYKTFCEEVKEIAGMLELSVGI